VPVPGARDPDLAISLYAADFSRLGEQVQSLLAVGARTFHFDVGDGHFIEDITMGPVVLKSIAPIIHRGGGKVGCHLMTENPDKQLDHLKSAGADSVTLHLESCPSHASFKDTILRARELGLWVGLAVNPETPIEHATSFAREVDFILCMNIHPGFSGQAILPSAFDRIRMLRRLLPEVIIEVDGGVHDGNIGAIRDAGANLIVVGSAVFWTDRNPAAAYLRLSSLLRGMNLEESVS
jgi:ribulose-phosphate 3-epimerase